MSPELTEQERLDCFAIYLSLPRVHERMSFEEAMADTAVRICLRNTAEAKRRRLAKAKTASIPAAAEFQLT